MYFLSWISLGWLSAGQPEDSERPAYGPFHGHCHGRLRSGGGRDAHAICSFGGYGGTIITTLVAILGAVLLTLLAGLVNGRRMYARSSKRQVGMEKQYVRRT